MLDTNLDLLIELGTIITEHPHIPFDEYWLDEARAIAEAREKFDKLYASIKMSDETFRRKFDV